MRCFLQMSAEAGITAIRVPAIDGRNTSNTPFPSGATDVFSNRFILPTGATNRVPAGNVGNAGTAGSIDSSGASFPGGIPLADVALTWDSVLNSRFDTRCTPNPRTPMTPTERACAASHLRVWRMISAIRAAASSNRKTGRHCQGRSHGIGPAMEDIEAAIGTAGVQGQALQRQAVALYQDYHRQRRCQQVRPDRAYNALSSVQRTLFPLSTSAQQQMLARATSASSRKRKKERLKLANAFSPAAVLGMVTAAQHTKKAHAAAAAAAAVTTTNTSSSTSSTAGSTGKAPESGSGLATARVADNNDNDDDDDDDDDDDFYVILEDDALIEPDSRAQFHRYVEYYMRRLPGDVDVMLLGGYMPMKSPLFEQSNCGGAQNPFRRVNYVWQLFGYVLRGRAVEVLLSSLPINAPADTFIAALLYNKTLQVISFPPFVFLTFCLPTHPSIHPSIHSPTHQPTNHSS